MQLASRASMKLWFAALVLVLGATVARHAQHRCSHARAHAARVAADTLRVAQCKKDHVRAQLTELNAELQAVDLATARALEQLAAAQAAADRAAARVRISTL